MSAGGLLSLGKIVGNKTGNSPLSVQLVFGLENFEYTIVGKVKK